MLFLIICTIQIAFAQESLPQSVPSMLTYLKPEEHIQLYESLLGKKIAYTRSQLAELGAQSLSHYIAHLQQTDISLKRVLIVVGQEAQNSAFQNGYYGLSTARLLAQMKLQVEVVILYPMDGLRSRLSQQCRSYSVVLHFNILQKLQDKHKTQITKNLLVDWLNQYDLIIDAISGYTVELKQPTREFVHAFADLQKKILSIDLPTGWHATDGNPNNLFVPKHVMSMGLPLIAMQGYEGIHVLGGKFIPPNWKNYTQPKFRGEDQYIVQVQ